MKRPQHCGILLLAVLLAASLPSIAVAEGARTRWFDLLTRDARAVGAFYGPLFNWEFTESLNGGWTARHDGATVAGVSELEATAPGVGFQTWLVGFQIDNLDRAIKNTVSTGGKLLQPISIASGFGSWAVVADPQGAPLLLFSANTEIGEDRVANGFVWAELWTSDPASSIDFYKKVLGWDFYTRDLEGAPYTYFGVDGEPRAGIAKLDREGFDTAWATYIGVEDLEGKMKRVEELGGKVLMAPTADFIGGRVAVIEDPTGVDFFMVQLKEQE